MPSGTPGLAIGVVALLAASMGAEVAVGSPVAAPAPPAPDHPPTRLVSTTLSTDEILLDLLRPGQLLAVGRYAADPAVSNVAVRARRVPHRVGQDVEQIVALEPDLVLADPFASAESKDLLARSGVPVLEVPRCRSLADIRRNLRWVGEVVGERQAAAALAARMDRRIEEVRSRVRGARRPRVLLWNAGGFTAGAGTLFDALVEVAGGRNAAAEAGMRGHVRLPIEEALQMDPEVIFASDYHPDGGMRSVLPRPALRDDPVWRGVRAVRDGRVYALSGRDLRYSHYAAQGAEVIARSLHPERFTDTGPEAAAP